jgi:signal recognition particle receptor subunit beta
MAVIDPRDNSVVIRIVYDGTPRAGKTTSMQALGRGFGSPNVYSPQQLEGRTLYFDWLDYTGGLFEGRKIRCQIVSVPGQATLASRRRRLLQDADVVVFVADTSAQGLEADRHYLGALRVVLEGCSGPPIGIVVQANKRDLPDALPLDALRAMLEQMGLRTTVVESMAIEGSGIRETFVFAVRLALDRVRELMRTNDLLQQPPLIDNGSELLQQMQQSELGSLELTVESGLHHTSLSDIAAASLGSEALREAVLAETQPRAVTSVESVENAAPQRTDAPQPEPSLPATLQSMLVLAEEVHHEQAPILQFNHDPPPAAPDARVASGLIWPPVHGRLILHETSATPPYLQPLEGSGWSGIAAGHWRFHSARDEVFTSIEAGRNALVQWARVHSAGSSALSKERCIVLAADGEQHFRLWQIVRIQETLHDKMERALHETVAVLAATLLAVTRAFFEMAERLSEAPCELPLRLDLTTLNDGGAAYVGMMPQPGEVNPPRPWSRAEAGNVLLTELRSTQPKLQARRTDLLVELARLVRGSGTHDRSEWHVLQRLL